MLGGRRQTRSWGPQVPGGGPGVQRAILSFRKRSMLRGGVWGCGEPGGIWGTAEMLRVGDRC